MPYHVGAKGSNGCSGYPVVSASGRVMGCHPTEANANQQVAALYASGAAEKGDSKMKDEDIMDRKKADMSATCDCPDCGSDCTCGDCAQCSADTMKAYEGCGCPTCKKLGVSCDQCPDCQKEMAQKGECCPGSVEKQAPCWEGYVQRGMKPGKNGKMVPNCVPAQKADDLWEDDDTVVYETDSISKADGYVPPAGVRAAARRAIKFKEDGKAGGAGTAVGWTRAGQLARGETLSLSTVKRMYSYFSRHEVDKKGKDWGNQANPSNGYIMWLAWGGDAGFAWSRKIVAKETDKMLFANFGREVGPAESVRDTYKRDFSTEQRQRMAEAGTAMPDGSYPIGNRQDLMNAIRSWGRGGADPKVKEHIKRRARALGAEDMIPENWKKSLGNIFDTDSIKPRSY